MWVLTSPSFGGVDLFVSNPNTISVNAKQLWNQSPIRGEQLLQALNPRTSILSTCASARRTLMGQCVFNALQTTIVNGRSATGYADNDWVTLVATVNGQTVVNQAFPLHNPKFYGQAQDNIFTGGDVALPFGTSVQCADTDTVICFFTVFNLSSLSWGDQVSAAATTVQNIGDEIAKIYFEAAQIALNLAVDVTLPGVNVAVASATDELLDKLGGVIGSLIDGFISGTIIPGLADLANFFQNAFGEPDCNGLVLSDYVIYLPHQPRQGLFIPQDYKGASGGDRCGRGPETKMNIVVSRELDDPNWLLFQGTANHPIGAPAIHKVPLYRPRPRGGVTKLDTGS
jgi:hypothetical protein